VAKTRPRLATPKRRKSNDLASNQVFGSCRCRGDSTEPDRSVTVCLANIQHLYEARQRERTPHAPSTPGAPMPQHREAGEQVQGRCVSMMMPPKVWDVRSDSGQRPFTAKAEILPEIIETKGRVWEGTEAMHEWCDRVSEQTGRRWQFARVNQIDFHDRKPKTLADAVRRSSGDDPTAG